MAAAVPAAVLALLLLPATAPATVHVPITTAATAKSIPLPTPPPQLVATTGATAQPAPLRPHILLLIADDYGWANAGWHSKQNAEVRTPHMNELVAQGIELNRACEDCSPHPLLSTLRLTFNVPFACHVRPPHADQYKFCSPTRCSLQSGRLPVHVNFQNLDPAVHNPSDPVSGFAGIPRMMTGMAELLKRANYSTHFIGKVRLTPPSFTVDSFFRC